MKPVVLTTHAELVAAERLIERAWVESVARSPEWTTNDAVMPGAQRRFAVIPERGDRVLRAVCLESDTEIRVITVFLDGRAKRPT